MHITSEYFIEYSTCVKILYHCRTLVTSVIMGGSTVEYCRAHRGGDVPPPRFLKAIVKSLIFTIGAPSPDFNAYSRL